MISIVGYSGFVGSNLCASFDFDGKYDINNIKEAFGKSNTEYIYNGNGSFVMLTEESDYITVEDIMRLFRLRLDEREDHREIVIEYKIGISETFKENPAPIKADIIPWL